MKRVKLLCLLLFFTSCYRDHLYVRQEWIDRNYLASTYVGTPDPRQKHPPLGQKILISFDFPPSLYRKELSLLVTVRLYDHEQKTFSFFLERRRGYKTLFFPNPENGENKRILTYKIDVLTKEGQILETWKHHFWTEEIKIEEK